MRQCKYFLPTGAVKVLDNDNKNTQRATDEWNVRTFANKLECTLQNVNESNYIATKTPNAECQREKNVEFFFLEKNQRIYFWIIIPNDKISFICRYHYVLAFGE